MIKVLEKKSEASLIRSDRVFFKIGSISNSQWKKQYLEDINSELLGYTSSKSIVGKKYNYGW